MTDTTATWRTLWDGRQVPALGLGCWAIGGPMSADDLSVGWGDVDDDRSIEAIHCALDLGVQILDTAQSYGAGHSEAVIGRALKGRPEDVVVITKFGPTFDAVERRYTGASADPDDVEASVHDSLRRLQRDRIDILLCHLNTLPVDEARPAFERLARLRDAGKIGAYGWSTDFPDRVRAFADQDGFVAIEHSMNVFVPATDVIGEIERLGLLSLNRSPLAMGMLTGKFTAGQALPAGDVRANTLSWMDYFKDGKPVPAFLDRLASVREVLTQGGRSLTQGALCWLWGRSEAAVPLPGFRTRAQVEENAAALAKGPLPPDTMAEIERLIDRPPEGPPRER